MKLILLKSDFDSESSMPSITSNRHTVDMGGDDYVYCDITSQSGWDGVKGNFNTANYVAGTGILLPSKSF